MERECFLSVLIILFGGTTMLACGWWPAREVADQDARHEERLLWRRIWLPLVPALIVVAWLCGWALVEPDPVPERVPLKMLLPSTPFLFLVARAAIRMGWSLFQSDAELPIATVGLLRPWILFSPYLAKKLDDSAIEAALEHERAHARHRDPLRIWLAQLVTDLQWPWPQASQRFRDWLVALELARDEEARRHGVEGSDLASAIVALARFGHAGALSPIAALMGDQSILEERVERLLASVKEQAQGMERSSRRMFWLAGLIIPLAIGLGCSFGESVIGALIRIAA